MKPVPALTLDGAAPLEQAELRVRDLTDKIFLVRMDPGASLTSIPISRWTQPCATSVDPS